MTLYFIMIYSSKYPMPFVTEFDCKRYRLCLLFKAMHLPLLWINGSLYSWLMEYIQPNNHFPMIGSCEKISCNKIFFSYKLSHTNYNRQSAISYLGMTRIRTCLAIAFYLERKISHCIVSLTLAKCLKAKVICYNHKQNIR